MLELLFVLQFIVVLGFVIKNFRAVYGSFHKSEKKQGILYAIYFSFATIFIWNPMDYNRTNVINFKRIIGEGVINGYDCTRVTSNFMIRFILLAVSFIVFSLFVNYVKSAECTQEQIKVWKFLDQFIVLALVNIILRGITYYYDALPSSTHIFYHSFYLIDIIILVSFAYIFLKLDKKITANLFKRFMIGLFCVSYPMSIILSGNWNDGRVQMIVQVLLSVVALVFIKLFYPINRKWAWHTGRILITSSLFPLFTSIYIEMINVLNQYEVFVAYPKIYYSISVLILLVFLFALSYARAGRAKECYTEAIGYPLMVIGITMLSFQIPLQDVYNVNLMETANKSILISDFLNFGSIPIVEHYGGHMMSGVWEGILYGIINRDYLGAVSSPYQSYILSAILAIIFYFIVKEVWNMDMALWTTLLFPFYNSWQQYGLGVLVCLTVLFYIKKRTYIRAFLIWLSCVWCVLYRLDLGYSFGIACVVALSVYIFYNRDKNMIKQLVFTLVLIVGVFLGLWCSLCIIKNINPMERLMEFIEIGLSNLNWGYNGIGDAEKTVYAWHYMFLPVVVELCLIYTIFSKKFKTQTGDNRWIILIILGTAYFSNFSRGLIRHSLVEMQLRLISWSAYIFIAIFVSSVKKRKELFLIVFTACILITTLLGSEKNYTKVSVLDTASNGLTAYIDSWTKELDVPDNEGTQKTLWEKIRDDGKVVQRVVWSDSITDQIKSFAAVIDQILDDDETYLDYVNRTFIYSAIGRKNPVYVSQSPLQLSGEFVQEKFVESVEKNIKKIPLAVLPSSECESSGIEIDGIANVYRYYKVSEFIYNHYEPLCSIGEFAIWCLPERYTQMREKLLLLGDIADMEFISYGYDIDMVEGNGGMIGEGSRFHDYQLKRLPEIWGELDKENAAENEEAAKIEKFETIFLIEESDSIDKTEGNYLLLTINNIENAPVNAELTLGIYEETGFNERYKYKFVILEDSHKYIFRISSDYFWYSEDINAVMLQCDNDQKISDVEMKILLGD